ncbi:hypothetical protein F5Y11DRAFT_48575 [Daldinia sp. FL1419]|nr:hypothetical protein F5Y11DRAFT_48575 [Daldinia sp. FL1419]
MATNSTSDASTPDAAASPSDSPNETTSAPAETSTTPPPPAETTSDTPDPPASTPDPTTSTTSEPPPPPPPTTTSSSPGTSSPSQPPPPPPPTTSTSSSSPSTPTPPPSTSSSTSEPPPPTTSVIVTTTRVTTGPDGSTQFITVTSTQVTAQPAQPTSQTSTAGPSDAIISPGASNQPHMAEQAKIAVAVVVPIAAVALLVAAGIFFWRRRKQRKDAAEERRKEVEDYSYNPNNDPTLPEVGAAGAGAYEMKEDGSGYRGWGSTTLAGSTGRKASTTMSGGAAGVAYSDATSPTRGNFSDTRSGEGLMNDRSNSPTEGEILGAMGPTGNDTGNGDVRRGPSNASSSYSAAGRSDGSGENGASYGGPAYLDQYGGNNPYADGAYGQPVIRDNPARRNTRIENPSHYPQQSTGISQNF